MSTVNTLPNANPETPGPRNGEPPSIPASPLATPGMDDVTSIKVRSMINANKKCKKGELAFTDEEIYEANELRLGYLARRGAVKISVEVRHCNATASKFRE